MACSIHVKQTYRTFILLFKALGKVHETFLKGKKISGIFWNFQAVQICPEAFRNIYNSLVLEKFSDLWIPWEVTNLHSHFKAKLKPYNIIYCPKIQWDIWEHIKGNAQKKWAIRFFIQIRKCSRNLRFSKTLKGLHTCICLYPLKNNSLKTSEYNVHELCLTVYNTVNNVILGLFGWYCNTLAKTFPRILTLP